MQYLFQLGPISICHVYRYVNLTTSWEEEKQPNPSLPTPIPVKNGDEAQTRRKESKGNANEQELLTTLKLTQIKSRLNLTMVTLNQVIFSFALFMLCVVQVNFLCNYIRLI